MEKQGHRWEGEWSLHPAFSSLQHLLPLSPPPLAGLLCPWTPGGLLPAGGEAGEGGLSSVPEGWPPAVS